MADFRIKDVIIGLGGQAMTTPTEPPMGTGFTRPGQCFLHTACGYLSPFVCDPVSLPPPCRHGSLITTPTTCGMTMTPRGTLGPDPRVQTSLSEAKDLLRAELARIEAIEAAEAAAAAVPEEHLDEAEAKLTAALEHIRSLRKG